MPTKLSTTRHGRGHARHFLLGFLAIGLGWAGQAQEPLVAANTVRRDFWDTDGVINAVLATNGVVYVGGSFAYVAPKGRKVAALDAYTGEALPEFPQVVGSAIHAILDDGNGGWFIGGSFTEVGGVPRTNLVRILIDHSVDPDFHPDPDASVWTLALDGSTLYVGGDFSSIAGTTRNRLAALNLATGTVSPWAPEANDRVATLLVNGSTVYAGGFFSQIGSQARAYLAALDAATGSASAWHPQLDGAVLSLALLEDRMFIGGNFNLAGGTNRNGLAALDLVNGAATPWNPNPIGGKVAALRVVCNTVYVCGYFTNIAGVARNRVAALDTESGLANSWEVNLGPFRSGTLPSSIQVMEVSGNAIYLGGEFNSAAGQSRRDLISVDLASGKLLAWNPNVDGGVSALAVAGRTLLAGFISSPGGVERRNLAAFDELTGRVLDWNPDADGTVNALAISGQTVYAGGSFTNVGGWPRQRLAAIQAADGQVLTNWTSGANNTVFALALNGSTLYAGGRFTKMGGAARLRLAALNASSGQVLSTWTADADAGTAYTLAVSGNTVFAGGSFVSINGSTRNHLAALETASGMVKPWDPNAESTVFALTVSGDTVYAGGSFISVGNQAREHVAAMDAVTGVVTGWNPGADDDVRALTVSGTIVYAGGTFQTFGGQTRAGIAAVEANGALTSWNPGAPDAIGNEVFALALSEHALFVAGKNVRLASSPSTNTLAVFPRVGAPVILSAPQHQNVPAGGDVTFSVATGGELPLFHQWYFNGTILPGETNATLRLTNLQAGQSGNYRVVVTNRLGTVTAEATLIVLVPVTITVQPAGQTVASGSTVTLSVSAMGHPSPIYQWRLNGVNIPGAVYPTLTLSNVTPQSGGSYEVAIANSSGAINSDIASVVVSSPALLFSDDFSARGAITNSSGVGSGSNAGASREASEPRHADKPGGRSVWVKWVAPTNGLAMFSTRGSGFDTLLGIYAGTDLAGLSLVASDEDRGGFLTSRATFNAVAGVEYQIVVDGFGGAAGNIVLSWETEAGVPEFPHITAQPLPQTVTNGGTATFSVAAESLTSMRFQWFFGCREIRGATNAMLVITNVQSRHVGFYHLVIMNNSSRVADSLPAALEIGPNQFARSFDKLEDLVESLSGSGGGGGLVPASSGLGGQPLLVAMGTITSQIFSTSTNGTSLRTTNHCGVFDGNSAWLAFTQKQNGVVLVDTVGSLFDTVLSVYRDTNLVTLATNIAAAFVECDDNGAPDGVRSLLRFRGTVGRVYLAVVSGVLSAKGKAQVNWRLGLPPSIVVSNWSRVAPYGTNLRLDAGVIATNPLAIYQWRLNGTNLAGATNSSLLLNGLNLNQAGTYTVVASNFAGMVTNTLTVNVELPYLRPGSILPDGAFRIWLPGTIILESSTNLTTRSWLPFYTNGPSNVLPYIDLPATNSGGQFYRSRPWP